MELLWFNYWWIHKNWIKIWILRAKKSFKTKDYMVLYEIHGIVWNYNLYIMNIPIYLLFKINLKKIKNIQHY